MICSYHCTTFTQLPIRKFNLARFDKSLRGNFHWDQFLMYAERGFSINFSEISSSLTRVLTKIFASRDPSVSRFHGTLFHHWSQYQLFCCLFLASFSTTHFTSQGVEALVNVHVAWLLSSTSSQNLIFNVSPAQLNNNISSIIHLG